MGQGGGQGGEIWGGQQTAVGHHWSDLAGDKGRRLGWGTREQCGSNKGCTGSTS